MGIVKGEVIAISCIWRRLVRSIRIVYLIKCIMIILNINRKGRTNWVLEGVGVGVKTDIGIETGKGIGVGVETEREREIEEGIEIEIEVEGRGIIAIIIGGRAVGIVREIKVGIIEIKVGIITIVRIGVVDQGRKKRNTKRVKKRIIKILIITILKTITSPSRKCPMNKG